MARENEGWGYTRILGALKNLKCKVSRTTIANTFKENGMDPSPERSKRRNWKKFIKAHWKGTAASGFFSIEVLTLHGLITYYVLYVIKLSTRRVMIARITPHPGGEFIAQWARNLTYCRDGRFIFIGLHCTTVH